MEHTFVALPENYEDTMLFDDQGKAVRQVLWGDWLWIDDSIPDTDPNWRHIVWAPKTKNLKLKIPRAHTIDIAAARDHLRRCRSGRRRGADHARTRRQGTGHGHRRRRGR